MALARIIVLLALTTALPATAAAQPYAPPGKIGRCPQGDPTVQCHLWTGRVTFIGDGGPTRASAHLHPRQRPRARPEPVRLDPQPLQHRHVQVRERRRAGRVERQVLAVLEAAPREEDRQVAKR